MSEYVITCCSTADMSRRFMEENKIPYAMFHYQMDGTEFADDLYASVTPEESRTGRAPLPHRSTRKATGSCLSLF